MVFAAFRAGPGCVRGGVRPVVLEKARLEFWQRFSNAGFMGIPWITAVVGEGAVFYIAGFVALLNILQWTYGQAILGDAQAAKPLGVLKNPW